MFKNIDKIFIDEDPNPNHEKSIIPINIQMSGPPPPPQLNQSVQSVKLTDTPSSPSTQIRHDSTNLDQSRTRRNSMQSLQTKPNIFLWYDFVLIPIRH